jgi:hypothetical protein
MRGSRVRVGLRVEVMEKKKETGREKGDRERFAGVLASTSGIWRGGLK